MNFPFTEKIVEWAGLGQRELSSTLDMLNLGSCQTIKEKNVSGCLTEPRFQGKIRLLRVQHKMGTIVNLTNLN